MNENKTNEDYQLNAKRPTYEGIVSLEFDKDYPIINLIDTVLRDREGIHQLRKPKNRGRAAEVSASVIKQWEDLHTNNKYDDFHNEAPMVDIDEVLGDSINTGYSKTKGKISSLLKKTRKDGTDNVITEEDTIGVWKVKFGTHKGKTGNYWMGIAQSNENISIEDDPDFIQSARTPEDVAGSLKDFFDRKDFVITDNQGEFWEDDLNSTMKSLKLDSKSTFYKNVKDLFFELIDFSDQQLPFSGAATSSCVNSEGVTVTIASDEKRALEEYQKNNPDVIVVEHFVLNKGEGGTAHALITKILEIIREHESDDHINIVVILKVGTVSSKNQLEKARPKWRDWFTNPNKLFMKQHKLWGSDIDLDKITFGVKFRYATTEESNSFWKGPNKYEFVG
tara:strand:- start:357 stop:1535 length:1179 start_codon:yes stop_codon:yes gene_type:complete